MIRVRCLDLVGDLAALAWRVRAGMPRKGLKGGQFPGIFGCQSQIFASVHALR